jgi:hypothetical protein
MNQPRENPCPNCGERRLKRFEELNDEERMIVARLPASAGAALEERAQNHTWCTLCWYESSSNDTIST